MATWAMQDVETGKAPFPHRLAGWRVLVVRDFRLLWLGKGLALLGDQCYLVLLPWLTLQLTGSGLALGTVFLAAGLPRAACILPAGILIDRLSPRRVLVVSTALRVVPAIILAVLASFDDLHPWQLYLLAATFGLLDAFFLPASIAIVPRLIPAGRLAPANALLEIIAQAGSVLGPILAGLVITALGVGTASGLIAAILLAALVALASIRGGGGRAADESDGALLESSRRSGLVVAGAAILAAMWRDPLLRAVLVLGALLNFLLTGPLGVGLPALAHARFPEGAAGLGILLSVLGGGALLGTLGAGIRPQTRGRGRLLLAVLAVLGLGLVLLSVVSRVAQAAVVLAAMGLALGLANVLVITWLQQRTAPALLGRVISVVLFSTLLLAPLSNVLAGLMVDVQLTLLFITAGTGLLMTALVAALYRELRTMD